MTRYLILKLQSPLIAFGGEAIDNHGVIRDFPALSMVTGLIANALGWDRSEDGRHNQLQQRLRMGSVLAPGSRRLQDFQTAKIDGDDIGWTTWGAPEERRGGAGTYAGPHLRYRDYHANLCMWVVVTLKPAEASPTLGDISEALNRPARPLFIGRKPCVPSGPIFAGWCEAETLLDALQHIVAEQGAAAKEAERDARKPHDEICSAGWRAQWPEGEGQLSSDRRVDVCDERNWSTGLHGGWRPVREGMLYAKRGTHE
ncbi:MAG: type I-E CRISPR-associated protein Cas5/CasD [Lautropia sp.]|nr:type I-E CRISPR-associated protein Cas5/CasD [Lautropia sp.]